MREFKGKTRVDSAGNVYHPRLEDAGWHFSYMGGAERCVQKLGAYSHPEYDRFGPHQWKAIKDFFCIKCGLVEIDETFPKFIRENIPYFEQAGFIWKE